jgi:hypothetical protein
MLELRSFTNRESILICHFAMTCSFDWWIVVGANLFWEKSTARSWLVCVRKLGNFRYILIPEIINKFMTIISDPVRTEHVHVFKLNLK